MTEDRDKAANRGMRERIGQAIKNARNARALTQSQLAERVGVTQGQIAKYESGADLPNVEGLIAAAEALGVPLDVAVGRAVPVEAPIVILRHGRSGHDERVHAKDLISIPLINMDRAASWKGMALSAKEVQGHVHAPLTQLKKQMGHRLACVRCNEAIPPLIAAEAILCMDYTDVPTHAVDADRGLFLTKDKKEIRICTVFMTGNTIILFDSPDSFRSFDLRRHRNPLIARVVWLCQPIGNYPIESRL